MAVAAVVLIVTLLSVPGTWATDKYKTLYNFADHSGGKDGWSPQSSLIFDAAGNLYGTAATGGAYGFGAVFELSPERDGSWTESVLHSFDGTDGQQPDAGLIFDQIGNLYGTTFYGGTDGDGVVFQLTPNGDGSWSEDLLYSFKGGEDAGWPDAGLTFDQAGNLYGATTGGGAFGGGAVFQMTPSKDAGWTESVLYSFCSLKDCADGFTPEKALIFDKAGDLYGTVQGGAYGFGAVFKLHNGDGSWTESVLHSFKNDGKDGVYPYGGVILDPSGNLYGTTTGGGVHDSGAVFKLSPNGDGGWTESVLHSFNGRNGDAPQASLTFDQVGNLYGTTEFGGAGGIGAVFELTPNSKGGWEERVLHSFRNHPGVWPLAALIFDAGGNLYGTTQGAGRKTKGSVFEITP